MDIVMPLALNGCHEELRYTLRSIDQNLKGFCKLFIATISPPPWLTDFIWVRIEDKYPDNKDGNIMRKIVRACHREDLDERFIFWSDDQVIIKEKSISDIPIVKGNRNIFIKHSDNKWNRKLFETGKLLKDLGLPTIFYDTHVPQPMNKQKAIDTFQGLSRTHPAIINTWHFNMVIYPEVPIMNMDEVKITCEMAYPKDAIKRIIAENPNKFWLGYNDVGWNGGVKQFMKEAFPNQSRFEKD